MCLLVALQVHGVFLLLIDSQTHLCFLKHSFAILKHSNTICALFYYLGHYNRQKTFLMFYQSLVNLHTLHENLLRGSTNHSVSQPLQALKNKIIRIICNVSKNEPVKKTTACFMN